jgi:16S rRNA (guanine966-N2)-methyltransferase
VIAGRLGGRTLVAPPGVATRPTSDRVREALFSILGDIAGRRVLDLYAGTGALGIEALSRGAVHATFVEHARPAVRALRQNIAALSLQAEANILSIRVERALSTMPWGPEAFHVVFMDPPYAEVKGGVLSRALAMAIEHGLCRSIHPHGDVVLEHASSDASPALPGLQLRDTRTYGDTALSFYLR